ncbi:hypothetical protein D8674_038186 [Pyrus ussuriensis x Pyrus communis]|uniref:Uncharacterized protein n=1 Tax=Pyrus ussuriensis x Pyrus communis TaxID=2448454 RepID=A0A5N5I3J8_9ROSA|nr:hypothetical protein D8674_038186 [Pyrus ussuriensis x Pyrus communis]
MFYRSEMHREIVSHINMSLNIKTQYHILIESSENMPPPGVNSAQFPVQVLAQGVPKISEDSSNNVVYILAPLVTPPPVIYINSEFDDEEDLVKPSKSVGLPECQFDLNED